LITGEIKAQVDRVWDAFWSGGISNPLSVIEQITYLLFTRRLDEIHTAREKQANLLKQPIKDPIFSKQQQPLRWSRFKDLEAGQMYELFRDEVFPFIKQLHGNRQSAFSRFMKDAVFVVPTPSLLERAVTMLAEIPTERRDTKGDLYEYMLSKIATAGQNGQFRTPRHIIRMMVELMEPTPGDIIGDPACGTCGFLIAAGEYLREHPQHKKPTPLAINGRASGARKRFVTSPARGRRRALRPGRGFSLFPPSHFQIRMSRCPPFVDAIRCGGTCC
jgi:type I restriction enzyme M protein